MKSDQLELAKLQAQRDTIAKAHGSTEKIDDRIQDMQDEINGLQVAGSGRIPASSVNLSGADRLPSVLRDTLVKARDNPELVIYKLKTNAYKFSWALIPISVPFVWLLFPFSRRFRLYDHTVFVTYSLCFMMLLLAASSAVGQVSQSIASFAFFVPPFHMYRQLRGTYQLSVWAAVWRTSLLVIFAFIAVALFSALLIGVGVID